MKQADIDRFFEALDKTLNIDAEVILIGAAAGALMGNVRPSLDIDFEIRARQELDAAAKEGLNDSIQAVSKGLAISVNFSDDIGHWSMIDYLDYREKAVPYKRIGRLNVKLAAPEHWTIGKMGRFLELDIQDMMKVIRANKIPAERLIETWAKALKASALSSELGQFRRHVEFFLKKCGPQVWGESFSSDEAISRFHRGVGIPS